MVKVYCELDLDTFLFYPTEGEHYHQGKTYNMFESVAYIRSVYFKCVTCNTTVATFDDNSDANTRVFLNYTLRYAMGLVCKECRQPIYLGEYWESVFRKHPAWGRVGELLKNEGSELFIWDVYAQK